MNPSYICCIRIGSNVIALRHLACLAAGVFSLAPAPGSATVILSSGPVSPLPSELGARARWGGPGFEAVMLDAGTQVVGTTLNPVGSPVWQLGQPHAFRLFWEWFSGTLTWQIDFDRNGSFGAGETASLTRVAGSAPTLTISCSPPTAARPARTATPSTSTIFASMAPIWATSRLTAAAPTLANGSNRPAQVRASV